jgi:hypothetical protein
MVKEWIQNESFKKEKREEEKILKTSCVVGLRGLSALFGTIINCQIEILPALKNSKF